MSLAVFRNIKQTRFRGKSSCKIETGLHRLYFFLYTRFHARKTVLGVRPCTWEIMHVKEQTCTLLIIAWHGLRNYSIVVLKSSAAKNILSTSILCLAPSMQITLLQFTWRLPSILVHYAIYLYSSVTIFDKLKWEAA